MNAFNWQGSSFATLPENHQFQTKKFNAWRIECRERPDQTPEWEVYRDQDKQPKKGRTKAEKVLISLMSPEEQAFNRKMEALLRAGLHDPTPSNFSVHIPTRAESDRTMSIAGRGLS